MTLKLFEPSQAMDGFQCMQDWANIISQYMIQNISSELDHLRKSGV